MVRKNYRKICQEFYGYTSKQMIGMDVHHIDNNHNNNHPLNLQLLTPKQHKEIHNDSFIEWARIGSKLGNAAFIKRLNEKGPTEKELTNRNKLSEIAKKGLHRIPHTVASRKLISDNKKDLFSDKTKHPLWGKTKYQLESPKGEIFILSGGWVQWCLDKQLNPSNLRKVALGKRSEHKGWKAKIIE